MPPRKGLSGKTNNSTMAQGNTEGKRKRVDIDLTISDDKTDDDLDAPVKAQKNARSTNATRSPPAFPTPPASSARSGYESVYGVPGSSSQISSQHYSEAERNAWLADDHDVNEFLESSQDDADGSDQLEHYGDLPTKIVGIRYYRGVATVGMLTLENGEPFKRALTSDFCVP